MEHFTMRIVTRIAELLTIVCVLVDVGCAQHANERVTRAINKIACELPPQPPNGRWKLHPLHCVDQKECDVQLGTTELPLGSRLVYSCNAGYKLKGTAGVTCAFGGNWQPYIPDCAEIRCKGLNTVSVAASCRYKGSWELCDAPGGVLPGTRASIRCKIGYRHESNRSFNQRHNLMCNNSGVWEPEPLRCVPDCGIVAAPLTPLIVDRIAANLMEFPWHASIYRDYPEEPKRFICGATIIQENLLITAAHCVYDTTSKGPVDTNKLYVMTGNTYRGYQSFWHNGSVERALVNNIYIKCNYQGSEGDYAADIAILELAAPFVLSASLIPACVDISSDDQLVPNENGKIAGFGRNSTTLQSLKLPYIPHKQCKSASENFGIRHYIPPGTFCAGNTYGSSGCASDSGSGLVFQRNGRWFLRGIVSVPLGARIDRGEFICDPYIYSLFTRLSSHIGWVQDVVTSLDLNRRPTCSDTFL